MPLNFTLHYDDRVNDVDDVEGDIAATVGVGWMTFTPTLLPGYRIPALEYSPRPTGIGVRAFTGYLDTDGRLKTEPGGETGIRLWGNDPLWNMDRFQYRVTAELTDLLGRPLQFAPFYFDAPAEDQVVYLVTEMPKPRQKFGRGRPGYGINALDIDENHLLVVTREDGVELDPVAIPEFNNLSLAYAMTFGR